MVIAATAVLGGLVQTPALADDSTPPKARPPQSPAKTEPDTLPSAERVEVLGKDYKESGDLAWTTTSDAQGFHLLTASERDGYTWRTAASLSEPGFDTDAWIGNACVTGSGKRAVVVYAPRTFTNKPDLMARGAFTAVVELETGKVTKLPLQASLAYYNPGCGAGEKAVLTQAGGEDKAATRLFTLDAATGKLAQPIETTGQVTSAVIAKDGSVVGANGARIVKVDAKGRKTALVHTDSVPYRLTPDADGGLVFLDKQTAEAADAKARRSAAGNKGAKEQQTRAKRIAAGQIGTPNAKKAESALLAEGPLTRTGLTRRAGTVYLTGEAEAIPGKKLPRTVRQLAGVPKDAKVSTRGEAVLTETAWTDGQGALLRADDPDASRPVNVRLTVVDSGKKAEFTVDPAKRINSRIGEGRNRTPALKAPKATGATKKALAKTAPATSGTSSRVAAAQATAVGDRNEVVESERVCSVPRNDPRNQAMQPKPRQVEWAVNMAIRNKLNTHVSRPADWKNLGMPAYQPQTLFPYPADLLGGATIPAQVMLGITAQESNMWQASRVVVPGVTGNPLIGNYYGIDYYDGLPANDWDIDWAEADCGYGITQVTDHMRMAGREDGHGGAAWDYQKQRAVALDYTANVAAGLHILADKWNQTSSAGMKVNNGNPAKLENWTFALWAYNSGFYPDKGDGSPWGLGWANNPANPEWDAARSPFMEDSAGNEQASDAAHPQDWPYQEKVLGFAAHPPAFLESPGKMVPAFRAAWWNGKEGGASIEGSAVQNRAQAKPPEDLFCDLLENSCDPADISDAAQNELFYGPCNRDDFKCWWNKPVQWKDDCDYSCGNDFTRFPVTWAEEPDGTAYPPNCSPTGLPAGALIVDDLPEGTPSIRPGCGNSSWTNQGTFTFDFGAGEKDCEYCYVKWPAKVDLHQLGAGFGGHFSFGHSRQDDAKGRRLNITGTWKLNKSVSAQHQVFVHLPDHGAQAQKVTYRIKTGHGEGMTKVIDQYGKGNRWISLGYYRFDGIPEVSLSTITANGTGDDDVAFDAVAFAPSDMNALPDISFPDPDLTAPDADPLDQEPENFNDGALSRRLAPAQECGKPNAKGIIACVTVQPTSGPFRDSGPARQRMATTVTPLVMRCMVVNTTYSKTRYDSCLRKQLVVELKRNVTGPTIGQANLEMVQIVKIPTRAGSNWSTDFEVQVIMKAIGFTGELTQITANELNLLCIGSSNCQDNVEPGKLWTGGATWYAGGPPGAGDMHEAETTATVNWSGGDSASNVEENLDLGANVRFSSAGTMPVEPTAGWNSLYLGVVRCDNKFPRGTTGCVYSGYQPTWKMNDKLYPAAAAYYWFMRETMATHPGSKKRGTPLHKEGDSAVANSNRTKVCDRGITAKLEPWSRHPDADGDSKNSVQCDEFPFASTKESGGQTLANGKTCIQLYAKRKGSGWHLYNDDRYATPTGSTWPQICARAGIPGQQNMDAGRGPGLSKFVTENRLLDGDGYFFVAPRFENCDPKSVCTVT